MEFVAFLTSLAIWQSPSMTFLITVLITILSIVLILKGKWLVIMASNKFFGTTFSLPETKKRSCFDCILLINSIREHYEVERNEISDGILKLQMNFAEQKMIEMETMLYSKYMESLSKLSLPYDEESKQSIIFYGILKDTQRIIKDEIRRSFKENGFHTFSGMEFSTYVKVRMSTIKALSTQNYMNRYPSHVMVINKEQLMNMMMLILPQMEDVLYDVYTNAKDIRLVSDKKLKDIKAEFVKKLDEFSGENNGRKEQCS